MFLVNELVALAAESQALKEILASSDSEDFAQRVFDKVFYTDIERLKKMEDMWKTRKAPTPLRYSEIIGQKGSSSDAVETSAAEAATLKDQRVWTLQETVKVFSER